MRGISTFYCLACEREECLTNSLFLDLCISLDTSEECPTQLEFCNNYLGDSGSAAVLHTVAVMRWVRTVNLCDSGAGEKTVRALAEMAPEHPHLRCVDLCGGKNSLFAMSGRLLLKVLHRCPKLVIHVNYDDFPLTMAQRLRAHNHRNENMRQMEDTRIATEILAAMPQLHSGNVKGEEKDVFYLQTHSHDGRPIYGDDENLFHLVENLNVNIEEYLESYQYVGRMAGQLAIDLGPSILSCIRTTAVAVPPMAATSTGHVYPADFMMSLRAVDALLGGLHANPFLLEELADARGPMLSLYVEKLQGMRGEYDSLMANRMGSYPSYCERKLAEQMRVLYNRIVAGIVQRPMTDLPSMRHLEQHLREVRVEVLDRLLDGRERVLPVLLAKVMYSAYNYSSQAEAWADGYRNNKRRLMEEQEDDEEEGEEGDAFCSSAMKQSPGHCTKSVRMCVRAMEELRELLSEPYTAARYAVTRPLWEALPMEIRVFFCDLALRHSASLYIPQIFTLLDDEEKQKQWQQGQETERAYLMGNPVDIVRVFERVRGRKELSEVLCAFEEWHRLRQVESYDVTHVSRQELMSVMVQM